jgi:hypothetical protein
MFITNLCLIDRVGISEDFTVELCLIDRVGISEDFTVELCLIDRVGISEDFTVLVYCLQQDMSCREGKICDEFGQP